MKYLILFLLPFSVYATDNCGITGLYDLSGWESSDSFTKPPSYTGGIKVTEYGGTYRFEGSADGTIYFGKGLTKDCKTFAFSFSTADKKFTGVTLLTKEGNDLHAVWTYNLPDTSGAGKEIWKKK